MTDDSSVNRPLAGDPARQAIPSLRGYDYQIWRTVDRWLKLKRGETLFIECAEDMDIASANGTTAIQVKDTEAKLSLANRDARDAIGHFWQLKKRSSGRVQFQFLTRASIATEQGNLLSRRPGIEVWKEAALGNSDSCELLRAFLLEKFADNLEFRSYLESQTPQGLIEGLFRPFEWTTEEPDADVIVGLIRGRLIEHGEKRGCSASISARVISDLHLQCWQVAKKKTPDERSLTREDFLLAFEKATSVLVPYSTLSNIFASAASGTSAVPVFGSLRCWTEGVPPLPDPILTRKAAVAAAVATLSNVSPLVLAGSAGKGKTTLGKLVALEVRKDCLWVDLSGRESQFAETALVALALFLDDRAHSFLVVIDDFPVEPGIPQGVWTSFGMVQRACSNSGSQLLITTKGIPRERLDARLVSIGASIQQIENLTVEEIKEFMEKLGCPEALSGMWSSLTIAQTGGHPKLVHIRALDLRDQGWPNLTIQGISDTPPSIAGQRAIERLSVAERESGPRLNFLYLLTLLILPFDRDFALRLGSRVEGLSDPGTVLDSFLGRWVEPYVETYFRITSLLTNEASAVWPPKKLREAHEKIFDSFLEGGTIDITHVLSVLLHAYRAQSPDRLFNYLRGLVDETDVYFPQIAKELKLVVYFGSGIGNRAIPFDNFVSLIFRHLQFRVASREAPEEISRIASEWLWEVEQISVNELPNGEDYQRLSKAVWASSVASALGGDLSPQIVISAISTFESLDGFDSMPSLPSEFKSGVGSDDLVAILFSFFQIRCTSIDYLDRLLDALVTVPAQLRSRMLSAAELPHVALYGFLIESAWIGEFKKANPNWTEVIRVLKRTKALAKEWRSTLLGLSASKATSIVLDEHLNRREAAVAALEDGKKSFGNAPLLDEQLANIFYRHHEFEVALSIWEKSLALQPDTSVGKIRDPFAFRKAAIAAGKTGDFNRAAELFSRGSYWAHGAELKHTASGLLFDAAYAFYMAKKLDQMVRVLKEGLGGLTGQPDPESEFNRFALQKLAGHAVLWILQNITGDDGYPQAEPILGMCSNPDYDSELKKLPPSPAALTIAHVVELEHRLGFSPNTRTQFASILQSNKIPALEVKLALVDLEQSYRQRRFFEIVVGLKSFDIALERAHAQRRLHQNVIEVFQGEVEPQDRVRLPVEPFLLCALTSHILSGGDADSLIEVWKERDEKYCSNKYSNAIDSLVQVIGNVSERADHVLKSAGEELLPRLVAAHCILISLPTTPDISVYAQAAYITWLFNTGVQGALREVLPILSASFANRWGHHLSQTALLINPRLSVPAIKSALAHSPDGAERIRLVLVAGSAATGVRLPQETIAWLSKIYASQ